MKSLVTTLSLILLFSASSCATVTGACTGCVTGLVDAPAEVYRHNRQFFDEHPMQWPLNIVVVAPLGLSSAKPLALSEESRWMSSACSAMRRLTKYSGRMDQTPSGDHTRSAGRPADRPKRPHDQHRRRDHTNEG